MDKKESNKHFGILHSMKHITRSMKGSLLPLDKDYHDTILEDILDDRDLTYISAKEDKANLRKDLRVVYDDFYSAIHEAGELCQNNY